jgi:hypothetical protein
MALRAQERAALAKLEQAEREAADRLAAAGTPELGDIGSPIESFLTGRIGLWSCPDCYPTAPEPPTHWVWTGEPADSWWRDGWAIPDTWPGWRDDVAGDPMRCYFNSPHLGGPDEEIECGCGCHYPMFYA